MLSSPPRTGGPTVGKSVFERESDDAEESIAILKGRNRNTTEDVGEGIVSKNKK